VADERQDEAVRVLQRLVRFDTVNPPGNERPAQEYLAGYLADAGLEVELLGAEPERPNLVARLRGDRPGPTLCLLSHVDTVLAAPAEWSHGPWSGDVADGFLWGRGALDMKSQTAAEAVAAAGLARAGWRPAGELLVVCVADEETGGALGAQWLCEHHPDKVRCDYLLNEGAGEVLPYDGRRFYGVCCAEKGVFRFILRTHGRAAHASLPALGDNALLKLAPLLERLADPRPGFAVTPPVAAFLRALGEDPNDPAGALAHVRAREPRLAPLVEPMLGVSFAPTMASASAKINVIPSRAELRVDCRVPPGLGEPEAMAAIAAVLGEEGYEHEWIERIEGNASPHESPLMDAIRGWLREHEPAAEAAPTILSGFSDSRHFRAAFPDLIAYGFFPQAHQTKFDAAPLVHGADERIDVRDLGLATGFFADVARRMLG
jgi:acetylornithine deacetylase/succinyl-diaminopimelate desuccinylase-like protein